MTEPESAGLADSVRLAWPAEAVSISELQRRSWATQWPLALAERMLGSVTTDEMTQAWHRAITRPPGATSRVLVAVDGAGRVVGFATTIPSADDDAEAGVHGEIDQFVIDPPAQRRGHGSRLLNACADTLRSDGFREASWWVGSEDDVLRAFLIASGWAADGASREIGSDDESLRLKQVRLHTDLGEAAL